LSVWSLPGRFLGRPGPHRTPGTASKVDANIMLISAKWAFIAAVLATGVMTAAPTPRAGQIAPNR
jgi:hypothetical protein